jgi:protoporphyrin/coproporphyrin ferrochelatase
MNESNRAENAYDAVVVVSFGGPESRDDVIPFLENVLRGRNVPRERLLQVAEHYYHFGGVSPLNAQNRGLIAALQDELKAHGPKLPIYFGNRNWHPLLPTTLGQMRDDGVRRALGFFTSAFSSYSGCRQYRENIAAAREAVGDDAPQVDKLRMFYNHPGYIEPMIELTNKTLTKLPGERRSGAHLVFTAHSVPMAMASNCRYEAQLRSACELVAAGSGAANWSLAYQSRSGAPSQPWLEPDVNDRLRELKSTGTTDVVIVPIGFISDHMEVLFDLDTEAKQTAESLGMNFVRAATVGTHPRFVRMIRELIVERISGATDRPALGSLGSSHDVCPVDCCLSGMPGRPGART